MTKILIEKLGKPSFVASGMCIWGGVTRSKLAELPQEIYDTLKINPQDETSTYYSVIWRESNPEAEELKKKINIHERFIARIRRAELRTHIGDTLQEVEQALENLDKELQC